MACPAAGPVTGRSPASSLLPDILPAVELDGQVPVNDVLAGGEHLVHDLLGKDLLLGLQHDIHAPGRQPALDHLPGLVAAVHDRGVDVLDGLTHVLDVAGDHVARLQVVLIGVHADGVQVALGGCLQHADPGCGRHLEDDVRPLVVELQGGLLAAGRVIPGPAEGAGEHLDFRVHRLGAQLVGVHESAHHRVRVAPDHADHLIGVDIGDGGLQGRQPGHHAGQVGALLLDEIHRGDGGLIVFHHGINIDEDLIRVAVGDLAQLVFEAVGDHENHVREIHRGLQGGLVLSGVEVALDGARLDSVLGGDGVNAGLAGIVEGVVAQGAVDQVHHTAGGGGLFRLLAVLHLAAGLFRLLRRGPWLGAPGEDQDENHQDQSNSLHDFSPNCLKCGLSRQGVLYQKKGQPFASYPGGGLQKESHYLWIKRCAVAHFQVNSYILSECPEF